MNDGARRLTGRERQIMDVIYQRGRATVAEVRDKIPDPPSYSAVRALLRILEVKGHLRHEQDGPRYVYLPTTAREDARAGALRRVVDTFFAGSPERAVAALLELERRDLDEETLDRIAREIDRARRDGR